MTKDEMIMPKGDGVKLQIIRNNMGLSVAEFAEKTEINPSFLKLLEKGCIPITTRIKRSISQAFGLQENWFDIMNENELLESATIQNNENESFSNDSDTKCTSADIEKKEEQKIDVCDGESLKAIRLAFGLSRKEVADGIGITSVQIGYIETGKRTLTEKVRNKLNHYFRTKEITSKNINISDIHIKSNKSLQSYHENAAQNVSSDEILKKIKMIKLQKGYTQTLISELSGVNKSQLSMIENGKLKISKNVREKLIRFISAEFDTVHGVEDISGPENTGIQTMFHNTGVESRKNRGVVSDSIFNSKKELIKLIESMKKTKNELAENINSLENVLRNM